MKSIVLILLIGLSISNDLWFKRVMKCSKQSQTTCLKWTESTDLYYYAFWSSYCFPKNTYVQTSNGPTPIQDLHVGDRILGMNTNTMQSQLTTLKAWLHWDPNAILEYSTIKTHQGYNFISSDMHNIGYLDKQNKISFTFLHNLNRNDKLVHFGNQSLKVKSTIQKIQKNGLFSPLTQLGTFFIYPSNTVPIQGESPMILVHSMSQIYNPINNFKMISKIIHFGDYFGLNKQPQQNEIYSHFLMNICKKLLWNDWVDNNKKTVKHKYYSNNYAQNHNNQQQKKRNHVAMVIAFNSIFNSILFS